MKSQVAVSPTTRARRRSAYERHALAPLQREIAAADSVSKCKYLRHFTDAYQQYERALTEPEFAASLDAANVILLADYHALAASQLYAAELIERLAASGREVVVALETVFARDQHILDDWMASEIDEADVRERLRFDSIWPYDWAPTSSILRAAKSRARALYGLDCPPRNDLRRIAARDRHAAIRIAEIRARHPEAVVLVLFGESHLAPQHLPLQVHVACPQDHVVTLLQNVDALYWKAAGEFDGPLPALKLAEDVLAVFTATPLEKYQSYRAYLGRWQHDRPVQIDLAPTFNNMVDAMLKFLSIDRYTPLPLAGARYFIDLYPEILRVRSPEHLERVLSRCRFDAPARRSIARRVLERGMCWVPELQTILVHKFTVAGAAEEVSRFVHSICSALPPALVVPLFAAEDRFYRAVIREALACCGSRALYPARPPVNDAELIAFYSQPRELAENGSRFSYAEQLRMNDFLILHRDFELSHARYNHMPQQLEQGVRAEGEALSWQAKRLGELLGSDLYEAYIEGRLSRRWIRGLFCRKLGLPGIARKTYFEAARRARGRQRQRLAA